MRSKCWGQIYPRKNKSFEFGLGISDFGVLNFIEKMQLQEMQVSTKGLDKKRPSSLFHGGLCLKCRSFFSHHPYSRGAYKYLYRSTNECIWKTYSGRWPANFSWFLVMPLVMPKNLHLPLVTGRENIPSVQVLSRFKMFFFMASAFRKLITPSRSRPVNPTRTKRCWKNI